MRQKLGQHFLTDQDILNDIVSALEITDEDTVIEIGPGHGELTKYLLAAKPRRLVVIERDPNLAAGLSVGLSTSGTEVIIGDALEMLPVIVSGLGKASYKLIGNIPYYITGHLMRVIEALEPKPERIVLTIQKEVAERICSTPPKMNLLAASVQLWGSPHITSSISRRSFQPRPEVDSAILLIDVKTPLESCDKDIYYKFIKVLFKQPRKTISNNLRNGLDMTKIDVDTLLGSIRISPNLRPGNLNIETIIELARVFRF